MLMPSKRSTSSRLLTTQQTPRPTRQEHQHFATKLSCICWHISHIDWQYRSVHVRAADSGKEGRVDPTGHPGQLRRSDGELLRVDAEHLGVHVGRGEGESGAQDVHDPRLKHSSDYLGSVWCRIKWTVIMYSISLKTRIGSIWNNACFIWISYPLRTRCYKCITMPQP